MLANRSLIYRKKIQKGEIMFLKKKSIVAHFYQCDAINAVNDAFYKKKQKKVLFIMATGLGKTYTSALWLYDELLSHPNQRVLFLCHNNDILEQDLKAYYEIFGTDFSMGLFHGGEKTYENVPILFASFQTMATWKNAFFSEEFDIIIVDESHHAKARSYEEVLLYFTPDKLLGMTATPDRMDGLEIQEHFGEAVFSYDLPLALTNGDLCPVEYRLITDHLNGKVLNEICKKVLEEGERISIKQLNESIFVRKRDEKIAEIVSTYRKENPFTVYFCEGIEHVKTLHKIFPNAVVYHSELSKKEQQNALYLFRSGTVKEILVVNKLNEGLDFPEASLIVFLRTTDSKTVWMQQLGRGLRKTEGKKLVTVLDFVANCERLMNIRDLLISVEPKGRGITGNQLNVSGEGFDFIFTDVVKNILDILYRISLPFYETIEEASSAAIALGITLKQMYFLKYKEDPRLPSLPPLFYRNKGWVTWKDFLGMKNKDFYKTIDEFVQALQKLDIVTKNDFDLLRVKDIRLPSEPQATYQKLGWVSWKFHVQGKPQFYSTLDEFKVAVNILGISSVEEYNTRYREDPMLARCPNEIYRDHWKGWKGILSKRKSKFYETLEEAKAAVINIPNITSRTTYRKYFLIDLKLPFSPHQVYENKGWKGWEDFFGKEKKVFYTTIEDATNAVKKLNIMTRIMYTKRYKEDPLLPSAPHEYFMECGWKGWEDFLSVTK